MSPLLLCSTDYIYFSILHEKFYPRLVLYLAQSSSMFSNHSAFVSVWNFYQFFPFIFQLLLLKGADGQFSPYAIHQRVLSKQFYCWHHLLFNIWWEQVSLRTLRVNMRVLRLALLWLVSFKTLKVRHLPQYNITLILKLPNLKLTNFSEINCFAISISCGRPLTINHAWCLLPGSMVAPDIAIISFITLWRLPMTWAFKSIGTGTNSHSITPVFTSSVWARYEWEEQSNCNKIISSPSLIKINTFCCVVLMAFHLVIIFFFTTY